MTQETEERASFQRLFPELSGEELEEAKRNFDGYLAVVLRIYNRVRRDPEAYRRFKNLTNTRKTATLPSDRSNLS